MSEKIKTFKDACDALKLQSDALPDVSALPEKHRNAITAHYKLIIIAQALNEGWEPNWNDSYEYKYYPWFEIIASANKPAGFGFSDTDYDFWNTHTNVGSRLCFKTRELALYAGEQFEELYKEYFLIA
jgi:hypothetical protein